MAEKEYIERGALLKEDFTGSWNDITDQQIFEHIVELAPAADVVAVVRCKDCKYKVRTSDGEYNPEDIVCEYHMSDGFTESDFCSYGERKEQK